MRQTLLLLLILVAKLGFGQVDLNLGLKAHYPFNGNASDVSGNNNHPVFNNATLTADRFGNPNSAYHFDGTSSYMKILNSSTLNTTNKLSLVAWVKPQGFYAGTCHGNSIIMKGDGDYLTGNYLLRYDDNAYSNGTNCSQPVDVAHQNFYGVGVLSAPPGYTPYIQPNQWYSVIVTHDGTTSRLYVNCELKASAPQGSATFTNAYDLYIGKLNNPSFTYWVNGDIDDVRIYDRALNLDEVNTLGGCIIPFACNNWLKTQSVGQSVTVGDLDISGNQITVEANFNCSSFPLTRPDKQEDIVSKHSTTTDINYVLRMDLAGITTTNGQFLTPIPCDNLVTNKTYHVAMVYNGSSLKFYRDGFLMSQIAASGNLILNNWQTTIGDYAVNNPVGTNFLGYINEVRIWNVARTQAELRSYMDASLPNPATQAGLQAYYTFDNLVNKQGNVAWNGTLNSGATVNNVNPNCTYTADSCAVNPPPVNISNVINTYTPVLALNPCDNKLTVEDGTTFNVGDTVLLIQMKGAVIDSTNTAAFGSITNYKNAGNYEFNYVKSKTANIIELKNNLLRQYDIPTGKVQLIRVPYYDHSVTINGTLTCLPWDGNKGGVLVLNVKDTITLNSDIDVSGKGFKGALSINTVQPTFNCFENNYYYTQNGGDSASAKGEGIAIASFAKSLGKGKLANAGGSGNSHNSGGGGGSNGANGGFGGYQWIGCGSAPFDNRGVGGTGLLYNNAVNKVFLGGGGGAGHDNATFAGSGGNGGGIAMIISDYVINNGNNIKANGINAPNCALTAPQCHEGMGGGGAGGSIMLSSNNFVNNLNIFTQGGIGGNMVDASNGKLGPGGGGSGGITWLKNGSVPGNLIISNTGGASGVCTGYANDPWGATAGSAGINLLNLAIPITTVLFQKNIDSVRIKDSITACLNVDFKGFAYTNANPINNWQWYFGDAGTANTQNTNHTYAVAGTYTVKLVVTDINGCKDSIIKSVTVNICNTVIINDYTPVLAFNPCDNKLTVENGTAYNVGDTVLLIQMKGAVIDSTNTAAFGTIIDLKNAGNYEFNYVKSKSGNIIELTNTLTRQYDIPVGKVQLIRVPYYNSLTTTDTLTCLPWDGTKGGVLAFNVLNTLTLNADINVSAKGFRGSLPITNIPSTALFNQTDYAYPANNVDGSRKGEGIAEVSENLIFCRGPLFSGGGGGNSSNSGGGGGGNAGSGGRGGNEWGGSAIILTNGGVGGKNYAYSGATNKVFMGGAGGAGQANDGTGTASGNGGGIVIITANNINPNGKKIIANGAQGIDCLNIAVCADGVGGGGAGGTVLLNTQTINSNFQIQTNGGKGADNNIGGPNPHGPGGGGGGGGLLVNSGALLASITHNTTGGAAGRALNHGNTNWGAIAGNSGNSSSGFIVPISTIAFVKNIDSVRIKDSVTACLNVDFKGLAYTNTNPISQWQWYFGDGGQAATQNTTHAYSSPGAYSVKLVVTDINGCRDSIIKPLVVNACNSKIINDYTPVTRLNVCTNVLTVENGTAFNVGDTVLLIQMKGAVIDSTNTAAFGTITDYKNSGNYEFNYIKSRSGNDIELKNVLTRLYDIPVGKVQLIRVPYFVNYTVASTDTLTCLQWDGNKGGVLVFNVLNTLTLDNVIDVSAKGFKGSLPITNIPSATLYNQTDFAYPANNVDGSRKGEGIAEVSESKIYCRGPLFSGGGGANSHNAGGGGGGNAGLGGKGGNEWGGSATVLTNGGVGGNKYNYSGASNKIFLGGGGGAGHANDGTGTAGGNGGGLVIITANTIIPNGKKIMANGAKGVDCINLVTCADGVGGGGAGGTVLLNAQAITSNFQIETNGGKGADNNINGPNATGPGGGGGGGGLFVNTGALFPSITHTTAGGIAGVAIHQGSTNWGAVSGTSGISSAGFIVPVSTIPFQKNIDSVRIKDSLLSCNGFDFKGLAYFNTHPIQSWQWYFGDGGQAATQNTSHAYSAAGLYTVKLIVTDINGCIDSTTKDVNALPGVSAEAGADIPVCSNGTVSVMLNGTAIGGPYSWSPAIYLNNPNIQNPTATISSTTTFYLTVSNGASCTIIDSVTVYINPMPLIDTRTDTAICRSAPLVLNTSSNATSYQWTPAASVSNPNIASPNYIGITSGWIYVTGSFASGCAATDSLYVTINPTPLVDARPDTAICFSSPLMLNTNSDATSFQWSPAAYVSNPNIASPDYIHNASGWVYVTGYFASGCSATDSLYVTVNPVPLVNTRPDTAICRSYPLVLNTNSNATSYQWSPAAYVSNPTIANPNFIGTASGWVYVTGSFASGCSATDSLYVTINPTPVVDARTDTAICFSSPLVLNTNSDATTFQWSPAAYVSNPIIASPNYIHNASGWVYVTGYFASGCSATDSLFVTVNPVPFVNTRPDTAICFTSPLVLNTSSNATIFQWSPAAYVSNPAIANPNYISNASNWVYITGSTAAGCFAKDSLFVTVNPLPVVQTIADTTLCQSVTITLTTTGAQTYLWSPATNLSNPNIASPVFTGNTGNTYTVTGTDVNGCTNTDMVVIDVSSPIVFKAPPAFTICEQKSVRLNGNNGNQVSYLWSPATYLSNATVINPLANPPQTTLYTLLVTDTKCGQDSIFTTLLTIVPAPVINAAKSNDIDCAFRSATLFASGGNQYLWSPSTGLSNPTIANPVATPANTQTYIVQVSNGIGCTNTDTVTVFNKRASSLARYMPNAFTPDGNGLNDCYGLKNWLYIQQLQFYIFNRYGEQVFGTANPNKCWDGTYKGKPALAGTYVYVIKAQTDCGLEEQKGTFILIR